MITIDSSAPFLVLYPPRFTCTDFLSLSAIILIYLFICVHFFICTGKMEQYDEQEIGKVHLKAVTREAEGRYVQS